jgi:hypothetical protein
MKLNEKVHKPKACGLFRYCKNGNLFYLTIIGKTSNFFRKKIYYVYKQRG